MYVASHPLEESNLILVQTLSEKGLEGPQRL